MQHRTRSQKLNGGISLHVKQPLPPSPKKKKKKKKKERRKEKGPFPSCSTSVSYVKSAVRDVVWS